MKDIRWIGRMHKELLPEGTGARHIIRFRSAKRFRRFIRNIRRLTAIFPRLSSLRPLPLINGLACSLRVPQNLAAFSCVFSVEADGRYVSVSAMPREGGYSGAAAAGLGAGLYYPDRPSLSAVTETPENPKIPWGVREIKAHEVWRQTAGYPVRVAVIDTGIDYTHPDLRSSTAGGINLIYHSLPPLDDNGHGTHIAGTIAASSRNGGILGVAPGAQIYAVKAFDRNGTAYVSDIVRGIDWCVRNRIDVINMSFGMKTESKSMEEAVLAAHRAGVVVVASSGNEGRTGVVDYPARLRNVIAVGATGKQKKIPVFSNRGRRVDIYAPGQRILSTWLDGGYQELSGTSMATSHVSGVIALLLSLRPSLSPQKIKRILLEGSSELQSKPVRVVEVNALRSVRNLLSGQ